MISKIFVSISNSVPSGANGGRIMHNMKFCLYKSLLACITVHLKVEFLIRDVTVSISLN